MTLERQAARIGAARAEAAAARIATAAGAIRGMTAQADGADVRLSAPRLSARRIGEPLLRVPADLGRDA